MYGFNGVILLSLSTIINGMIKRGYFVEKRQIKDGNEIEILINNVDTKEKTVYYFNTSKVLAEYRKQRKENEFNKKYEIQILINRCCRMAIDDFIHKNNIKLVV